MKKVILYIHGKNGSHLETSEYKKNCINFDIIGLEYNDYLPWVVKNQIILKYEELKNIYDQIWIIANSIGAYFAMLALQNKKIEKSLFISPITDMEKLIIEMMEFAHISEENLKEKGEIITDFGETLSWVYLDYVRKNPIKWNIPTEILYGEKDNLVSVATIYKFIDTHNAKLTIFKNGEHWFHTKEQIAFLNEWMKKGTQFSSLIN
ncbi:alpha/beta hydrolase [Acholeplasma sp. OttesenSCG-928-E16]|nr:alpha/beta hydrolase [Acholeplasma sp. OttesenSCG-928-E16]